MNIIQKLFETVFSHPWISPNVKEPVDIAGLSGYVTEEAQNYVEQILNDLERVFPERVQWVKPLKTLFYKGQIVGVQVSYNKLSFLTRKLLHLFYSFFVGKPLIPPVLGAFSIKDKRIYVLVDGVLYDAMAAKKEITAYLLIFTLLIHELQHKLFHESTKYQQLVRSLCTQWYKRMALNVGLDPYKNVEQVANDWFEASRYFEVYFWRRKNLYLDVVLKRFLYAFGMISKNADRKQVIDKAFNLNNDPSNPLFNDTILSKLWLVMLTHITGGDLFAIDRSTLRIIQKLCFRAYQEINVNPYEMPAPPLMFQEFSIASEICCITAEYDLVKNNTSSTVLNAMSKVV